MHFKETGISGYSHGSVLGGGRKSAFLPYGYGGFERRIGLCVKNAE